MTNEELADAILADAADNTETREGWQTQGAASQRKWHYIIGSTAICERFGFYFGEVDDRGLEPGGDSDCAECKRRVLRRIEARS